MLIGIDSWPPGASAWEYSATLESSGEAFKNIAIQGKVMILMMTAVPAQI
jgi:hypothetical protein